MVKFKNHQNVTITSLKTGLKLMAEQQYDALTTMITQLKKVLPTTAAKLGENSEILECNPGEIEVGTIIVSREAPNALDVVRFFQVVKKEDSKIFIKEIHQLNKYEKTKSGKIGLCSPLKSIFLSHNPTIAEIGEDHYIYLDGEKFGEKLPYDIINLGSGLHIKVYLAQVYTPLF